MLESGEIDALFTASVPQSVMDGTSKNIARLFPDYKAVGRDYYQRTRIYSMMHPVVMRKELLAAHPGLARAVYAGFLQAKQAAEQRYEHARRLFGATLLLPGPASCSSGTPSSSPPTGGPTEPRPTGTPSTPTSATTTSSACLTGG